MDPIAAQRNDSSAAQCDNAAPGSTAAPTAPARARNTHRNCRRFPVTAAITAEVSDNTATTNSEVLKSIEACGTGDTPLTAIAADFTNTSGRNAKTATNSAFAESSQRQLYGRVSQYWRSPERGSW